MKRPPLGSKSGTLGAFASCWREEGGAGVSQISGRPVRAGRTPGSAVARVTIRIEQRRSV
jgi:hypothetical protein